MRAVGVNGGERANENFRSAYTHKAVRKEERILIRENATDVVSIARR